VRLNGNAAFALQIHVVQQLILFFSVGYGTCGIKQPIGKRALAVVDVRDNAEISNMIHDDVTP
jgi:hypothetical protein